MLRNLKTALEQKKITVKTLAVVLGVSEKTAWNKINEETELTYKEAMKISTGILPEYKLEYLFASDKKGDQLC
ncbi:DNA-binding protein [Clostridium sp. AM45-5]|nr:DNA-binding protein [Clostridium sp. AM45-5]RHS65914.1 DNA-binding protein [Clostridium sp. AM45-5]